MILKSYIIEQDINILEKYISTIFYGENDGIKDDIKKEIKSKNKNAEIINLFQEEIIKNKNILIDQINNSSLSFIVHLSLDWKLKSIPIIYSK